MSKTIYSDYTDANGVSYPTIGENIRNGAKNLTLESFGTLLENRENILFGLNADSKALRESILAMFGAFNDGSWGDKYATPFSTEELQVIKTSLGIN